MIASPRRPAKLPLTTSSATVVKRLLHPADAQDSGQAGEGKSGTEGEMTVNLARYERNPLADTTYDRCGVKNISALI
jgi:hypothetical protein